MKSQWGRGVRGAVRAGVLVMALAAGPDVLEAQSSHARSPILGAAVGAGAGITVGLGLAGATDYPLKEGGLFTVAWLGGGLGALTGHKLSRSLGQPWRPPGRLQVAFPWAIVRSDASGDVEGAFSASGNPGDDGHHALAPAVTVTWDAIGPVRIGGEISGIRGVFAREESSVAWLAESLDGWTGSLFVLLGTRPSEGRRVAFSVGGGADRYSVAALSYFGLKLGVDLPPENLQPGRSSRTEADGWSGHARAGIELYLTYDVSLKLDVTRRWRDPITVAGIRLVDAAGATVAEHGAHALSLSSRSVSLGVGMRF